MRFTLPVLALLVSTVLAIPTSSQPSISELTTLAEDLAAGAPVPEGVIMLENDEQASAEEALNTPTKRDTMFCGAKSNGTCCCTICPDGRLVMCTQICGITLDVLTEQNIEVINIPGVRFRKG
ncbi:hypothetical protein AJ80_07250 [Polytolypa hystricis UAMH7299]|uniref:Hydrophobin n=1 Tax=Polytolypa hystricis (strain UAMH7299) TaxID=1447883 RepID=A0A2B7XRB2_POLH7|nr:hypothetical protein AJ80_07250 [Polytolypa hystricis UAMH7299]